ncbi:MAG: DUF4139 domain-containing protein [Candidatus Micrarchaeota archaeon]
MKTLPPTGILAILFFASMAAAAELDFTVKEAVIYPQKVALVTKEATIKYGNSFSTVLDSNAYPKSVRIQEDNARVLGIRLARQEMPKPSQDTQLPLLDAKTILLQNQNRFLRLITDTGMASGTVMAVSGDTVVLSNAQYSLAISNALVNSSSPYMTLQLSAIRQVALAEKPVIPNATASPPAANPSYPPYNQYSQPTGNYTLSWTDSGSTPRKATLSYFTKGLSWEPVYYLDIGSGPKAKFQFLAKIDNALGSEFSDVRLVAGNINLANYPLSSQDYRDSYAQGAMGESGYMELPDSSAPSVSSLDEYEVYSLPGISLQPHEIAIMSIFDDNVEYVKEYVYDARANSQRSWQNYNSWEQEADGKVRNIYRVKNAGQTWPSGIVSVYSQGVLIGEDSIEWTTKAREAKVTAGVASDIEASRKETVKRFVKSDKYNSNYDYSHSVTIALKNYKVEKVSVRVLDSFPAEALNLTTKTAFVEKPGNLMEWIVALQPGEAKELSYTFITD